MRKFKTHKVTQRAFRAASKFRVAHSFWNPAMTPVETVCGTEPLSITTSWEKVTCKNCLNRASKTV